MSMETNPKVLFDFPLANQNSRFAKAQMEKGISTKLSTQMTLYSYPTTYDRFEKRPIEIGIRIIYGIVIPKRVDDQGVLRGDVILPQPGFEEPIVRNKINMAAFLVGDVLFIEEFFVQND